MQGLRLGIDSGQEHRLSSLHLGQGLGGWAHALSVWCPLEQVHCQIREDLWWGPGWLGAGWALIHALQGGLELQENRGGKLPGLLGASLE